jgi:hypothetical protein
MPPHNPLFWEQGVASSNPAAPTNNRNYLRGFPFFILSFESALPTLIARYGAGATIEDVLRALTADCTAGRDRTTGSIRGKAWHSHVGS